MVYICNLVFEVNMVNLVKFVLNNSINEYEFLEVGC